MQNRRVFKAFACILVTALMLSGCSLYESLPFNKQQTSSTQLTADEISCGRYYFDKLNENQRALYCAVRDNVENMSEGMIKLGKCDETDATLVCKAVMNDYPEYFWMPLNHILYAGENGECKVAFKYDKKKLKADYYIDKSQKEEMVNKLESALKSFDKGINDSMTPYEKELYIHDRLCDTVTYVSNSQADMLYTAYGALVEKRAVCSGYAKAMQLLCERYSIPCHTVTGTAADQKGDYIGHMWNQIKLDDRYYNLDVTWDDSPVLGCTHTYFNIPDSIIKCDHVFDKDYNQLTRSERLGDDNAGSLPDYNLSLPACVSTTYNYHTVNHAVLTGNIKNDSAIITAGLRDIVEGKSEKCELMLAEGYNIKLNDKTFKDVYPLNRCALKAGLTEKNYLNIATPGRCVIFLVGNN